MADSVQYERVGTHTSHCCAKHGCKYGPRDLCAVADGGYEQEHGCPYCMSTKYIDEQIAKLMEERAFSATLEARGLSLCDEDTYGY